MARKKKSSRGSSKGRTRGFGPRNVRSTRTPRTKKKPAKRALVRRVTVKPQSGGGTSRVSPKKRPVSGGTSRVQRAVTRPATNVRGRQRPTPDRYPLSSKSRVKLRAGLELVRNHIHGFDARDGFDIRKLEQLSPRQRGAILRRAKKLRELTAPPHDTIKATTRKARKSLNQFTKQRIRGAKHYIVHKPADNFRVRIDNGRVEIEGRFTGNVITRSQFFLFPRRPRYPKELVSMARKLLKEMPPGFYTILTAAHGDTGEPFERDQLINRLNEYLAAYEVDSEGRPTGFSEALVGFRFMATTLRGASIQRQAIDRRREKQRDFNRKQRLKAESEERRRLTQVRCGACGKTLKQCRGRRERSGKRCCEQCTHGRKRK